MNEHESKNTEGSITEAPAQRRATATARSASASASNSTAVIPVDQGQPSAEKKVGTIPADWSAGQETLVSGSAANKSTEDALIAYPRGIVDRVVVLSDGDYNDHFIGVNWPHHVFQNSSFKVMGAE
jgi:hypothetical protein